MSEQGVNGSSGAPQQALLRRTVLTEPGICTRLIYTSTAGDYLGEARLQYSSADMLKLMLDDLSAWYAQQFGGIQVANQSQAAAFKR